ncbi:hypothetical protein I3J27_13425 [Bradyrhizobium xenonodulans]|uniref:Yop protein translocation protein D periplasmic domain-containing protein n=1 Tax=Bradyrhizobium xenonodulans TaxID=2736875 RepID=A0ABY7MV07_9BRAD|nr:hypothetical protein [Bradyrhizobium xenonodulans]WBL81369.1 hypothetical protein I3J27_13425 [Bradyrhizobium xenonodulans]
MPAGTYVIGGGVESDMVFLGEGLALRHVVVTIDGNEARVEALAEGASLAGAGALKVGRQIGVRLPFALSIADLRMSWTASASNSALDASQDIKTASGGRPRWPARLSVAGIAVAVMASSLAAVGSGAAGSFIDIGLRSAATKATAATVGSANRDRATQLRPPAASLVNDAANALKSEAEGAGLLNVAVEASGGAVMARGTVEPSVAGQWQSVQQWFDERFKGEVLLVNGVAVKAEKLPSSLAIEAVWLGPQSHVVIRGQKYLEGAMVDDGWAIQRIEAERIVLRRAGRQVAVRY